MDVNLAFLAAIVESSDDAIIGITPDGRIASWNRGAEKLYGYSAVEMIGRHVSVLVPPELHEEAAHILEEVRKGATVDGLETLRLRKDRKPVEVYLTVSPIRDAGGNIIGASSFARERPGRNHQARSPNRVAAERG